MMRTTSAPPIKIKKSISFNPFPYPRFPLKGDRPSGGSPAADIILTGDDFPRLSASPAYAV
jgi:hypothetical protein